VSVSLVSSWFDTNSLSLMDFFQIDFVIILLVIFLILDLSLKSFLDMDCKFYFFSKISID
jgi:hypothetical protein